MEIEIFTLCDHASDFQGKLVIVGTFDVIFSKTFPAVHPSCAIVCRIRFSDKELGQHKLKLKLIDSSSKDIVPPIEGDMNIEKPKTGQSATINFLLNLAQLKFDDQGRYSFELYIDDEWVRGLPLTLTKIQ
jgi:hypothetical protein